tara:strand:- start:1571 stop:1789 length:219 start_codon:yes stop_codon:yes gene_type:complete
MNEIEAVKELGEKIGYGNMMSISSALWRKSAKEKGYPISGAFVPTCLEFIKEDLQDLDKRGRELYDKMVSEY